jgi:hypothetical protein
MEPHLPPYTARLRSRDFARSPSLRDTLEARHGVGSIPSVSYRTQHKKAQTSLKIDPPDNAA